MHRPTSRIHGLVAGRFDVLLHNAFEEFQRSRLLKLRLNEGFRRRKHTGIASLYDGGRDVLVVIRRPELPEHSTIRALVQTVVDEIYGHLWASPPLAMGEEDWGLAWVAVLDEKIVGVLLTDQEWISDLWVLRYARRQRIGEKLLAQAEAEIRDRGYRTFHLRVVKSNTGAIRFYQRHEWRVKREFAHENLPITMLEMSKEVNQ